MKFDSYVIGHLSGMGANLTKTPRVQRSIDGHWFESLFHRMTIALDQVWEHYAAWTSFAEFDVIGGVAHDTVMVSGH